MKGEYTYLDFATLENFFMSNPVNSSSSEAYGRYVEAYGAYEKVLEKCHTSAVQEEIWNGHAPVGASLAERRLEQTYEALRTAEKAAGYGDSQTKPSSH